MPLEVIIPICVSVAALLFTAFSFRRTVNQDTENTATERATMSADIKYIRSSIDDIKLDNRAIKNDLNTLQTKVAKVEESVESAHKRLDDFANAKKG